MFKLRNFSWLLLATMTGCSTVTEYNSGAIVLDISESEAFNSRLETTPEFISAYEAMKADDFTRAEALLDTALNRKPKDPYALLAMGTVHERTGRFSSAADLYKSADHYGFAAAGPQLTNGNERAEDPRLTVRDIARHNLSQLQQKSMLRP